MRKAENYTCASTKRIKATCSSAMIPSAGPLEEKTGHEILAGRDLDPVIVVANRNPENIHGLEQTWQIRAQSHLYRIKCTTK